jgi:hypothetical protein
MLVSVAIKISATALLAHLGGGEVLQEKEVVATATWPLTLPDACIESDRSILPTDTAQRLPHDRWATLRLLDSQHMPQGLAEARPPAKLEWHHPIPG